MQIAEGALRQRGDDDQFSLLVLVDQFEELVDVLQGDSRRIPVRTEQTDLWDRWEALALLMLFLGVEWAVRKRFNLL